MLRPCCHRATFAIALAAIAQTLLVGCGTTRSTDTGRTATEQLLISDAIDRAVQTVDFRALSGQSVYLDDSRLTDVVDRNYLVSTLRQHLLASGCSLRDKADAADFVVEARAGAVGTDRNDLLFGVPSMNVPQILPVQPVPAAIPEIPLAKRRDQRGIAKISVFAYQRATGMPVWQSGAAQRESSSNDVWILGAGPFQRGTIYEGTAFAGKSIRNAPDGQPAEQPHRNVALGEEKLFASPAKIASTTPRPSEPAVKPTAPVTLAAATKPSVKPPTSDDESSTMEGTPATTAPSSGAPLSEVYSRLLPHHAAAKDERLAAQVDEHRLLRYTEPPVADATAPRSVTAPRVGGP